MLKTILLFLSTAVLAAAAIDLSLTAAGRKPQTVASSQHTFLGFDRDIYPGDAAFQTLHKTFAFTGYWLSPPPTGKVTSWIAKRDFLRSAGFGFLVLYRGRDSHEFKRNSDGPEKGTLDAHSAVAAAKQEGFPANTIIFLDIEEGGRLAPVYHAYLHAWADVLARNGYRAGVYCSAMPVTESASVTILTSDDIRANAGGREFAFFIYNDACPPSPGCSFPVPAPPPQDSGVSYALAWQFAQSPRRKQFTVHCPSNYRGNGNCYSPPDTAYTWELDVDTASTADPSDGAR